jgi:N-methylhydantoinase A
VGDRSGAAGEALRERLGPVTVVASSEVLPAFREYERFTTAVADAYLTAGAAGLDGGGR